MDLKKKYTEDTGEKPYCWTKSGMYVKSGSYSDGYVKWLEKQLLIHSVVSTFKCDCGCTNHYKNEIHDSIMCADCGTVYANV